MATLESYRSLSEERAKLGPISDDDVITAMTTATLPAPVPVAEATQYLLDIDKWVTVEDSTLRAGRNLKARLNRLETIDTTDAVVVSEVNGMAAGGEFTRDEADGFLALGQNRISIAQSIGWGGLRVRDLGRLRGEEPKLIKLVRI